MFFGHEHLGKAVALLRDSRGLDQTELAERAGIKSNALSQYEKGNRGVNEKVFLRICEVLDFDPIKVWDLAYRAFRYNYYLEQAAAEGITVEELIDRMETQPSQQRIREGYQAWKAQESRFFELILPTLKPSGEPGLESPGLLKMRVKPPSKGSRKKVVRFDPPKGRQPA
jgi:transcriptional regulator with XRE-family HTH domain